MAEPTDAMMPILKKIQEDVSAVRSEQRAQTAKLNNMAENILEIRDEIEEIRKDNLVHLGLTAKHRIDFEELRDEVQALKARVTTLESRS